LQSSRTPPTTKPSLQGPSLARIALGLNLLGTILLALSFSATSSDFKLVTAENTDIRGNAVIGLTAYAICVKGYALAVTDAKGSVGIGMHECPNWANSYPSAVVIADHPVWLLVGLISSMLGFLLQFLAIRSPKAHP
jgi:hypothetical protein